MKNIEMKLKKTDRQVNVHITDDNVSRMNILLVDLVVVVVVCRFLFWFVGERLARIFLT